MALKTYPWNPIDGLTFEKEIQAYLDAAMKDGDPALIIAVVQDIATARDMNKIGSGSALSRGRAD
jgi:probable addiction module antidote protein